ncbi:MAG: carbon-nitrogen hydrolase family protein [Armatimonadetes bacterium]|nr:carbon-nitrogen hydrolase family protein [Armatimonadota bacterium]
MSEPSAPALANLIANGDFSRCATGGLPDGWEVVAPNPALAPCFAGSDGRLAARGNGRRECFGYVRHPVPLAGGRTYRLRVVLRPDALDDLNQHLVHGIFRASPHFNDGVFEYRREDGRVVGEAVFPGPEAAGEGEVRLYFRFSAAGAVEWKEVSLTEAEPIPPRRAKLTCTWGTGGLDYWSGVLDAAGEAGSDLVLLPEGFNGLPIAQPEPLSGPTGSLMAAKARQWRMYVSGSFYERRGDLVYNTAPLYDRAGALVGTYEKVQLYDPEEDEGATPGHRLPVFDADFGRVGIIICYDSWFPEPTRLLAYRGAELILFPNAGYFTGLMPARAADNGVWFAVSSQGCPAGIWDSGGAQAGEPHANPTRFVNSSVCDFHRDEERRMLSATVDLSRRWSPHWWGGPMRSAPGGRRCRQTLMEPLEEAIAAEARRWWRDET